MSRILYWSLPMPHIFPIVGLTIALCPGALAQTPNAPLRLTLDDAMQRARANSPQILTANINALLARQDTVQARAALLPSVNTINQYIYTQTHDGSVVFVSNDGPNVFNNQLMVHGDIFAPQKFAGRRRGQATRAGA